MLRHFFHAPILERFIINRPAQLMKFFVMQPKISSRVGILQVLQLFIEKNPAKEGCYIPSKARRDQIFLLNGSDCIRHTFRICMVQRNIFPNTAEQILLPIIFQIKEQKIVIEIHIIAAKITLPHILFIKDSRPRLHRAIFSVCIQHRFGFKKNVEIILSPISQIDGKSLFHDRICFCRLNDHCHHLIAQ